MGELSLQTVDKIKSTIDAATSDPNGIPGTTIVVVDRNGKELLAHASGKKGVASNEKTSLDTIYWIASCTKQLVGIACMQLVEQGKLSLDDSDALYKLVPELKEKKVLEGDAKSGFKLVDKKKEITLRMLLSHTAGFGYTFFNEKLRDWGFAQPVGGIDEFTGSAYDITSLPLANQPGSRWEYGVNIDWAGVAVERASGLTLNDYLIKNIFEPMGLKNINMIPTGSMKEKLALLNVRKEDGSLTHRDFHIMARALRLESEEDKKGFFFSGGGGCFAKPQEYAHILATLINEGKCPHTGHQLLKPETVKEMFTNQIPEFPEFGRQGVFSARPSYSHDLPDMYPTQGPQGWGLTMFLSKGENGGPTGRSAATGHWAGLPNLWWWADPENGIAGFVCTQILPFGDAKVLDLWGQVEATVYGDLKQSLPIR